MRELADQEVLVREDTIDNHLFVADARRGGPNINSDQRLTIAITLGGDLAAAQLIDATKRHGPSSI